MPLQRVLNASLMPPQRVLNASLISPQRVLFLLHAHRTFILFSSHVKLRAIYGVCTYFSRVMYSHRIVNWLQIVSAEIQRIYLSLYCSLAADILQKSWGFTFRSLVIPFFELLIKLSSGERLCPMFYLFSMNLIYDLHFSAFEEAGFPFMSGCDTVFCTWAPNEDHLYPFGQLFANLIR